MNTLVKYCLIFSFLFLSFSIQASSPYSLVINNGRVIDPETKLDGIRHIAIENGSIVAVSSTPLKGQREIEAKGLVVSPGFIDLHTHSPTELGQYYQLYDGVTTALELEAGAHPVMEYGSQISEKPLINFGASSGYLSLRLREKDGIAKVGLAAMPYPVNFTGVVNGVKFLFMDFHKVFKGTFTEPATDKDLRAFKDRLIEDLNNGSLGIGLALDYISEAVDKDEIKQIFEIAGEKKAPIFVHVRRGVNGDPSGLREVVALAKQTGAPVHICHITHNAMRNIDLFLKEIKQTREEGVDITAEILPFNAGSTAISAAVFNRNWQEVFDITYEDIEWAETGERMTKESWENHRKNHPQGMIIHHYLKEEWTQRALVEPGVIVVSDIVPMESKEKLVPPHNGAFTKIIGTYVREKKLLSLSDAIEKMTLLPAKRLEGYAPAFKKKGRIQVGADADIVLFDPNTVVNNASYRDPYQEASGIEHVLVNGVHLVDQGQLIDGVFPGKRIVAN